MTIAFRSITASAGSALAISALFAGIAAALIVHVERGPVPQIAIARAMPASGEHGAAISLAGSGANLPLTRLLANGFAQTGDASSVLVHDSIGSGGGLSALRDGVIDAALVSRPLRPQEATGVLVVPYARAAVVLAAHQNVPSESLEHAALVALYAGTRTRWRNGQPVVLLQRERGDSAHRAVDQVVPGFQTVNESAWRTQRFPVAITDDEMSNALLRTEGAAGLIDWGTLLIQKLPLTVFSVAGVTPSVTAVQDGSYPLTRDLTLVTQLPLSSKLARFLAYLKSDAAITTMRSAGYLPVLEHAP